MRKRSRDDGSDSCLLLVAGEVCLPGLRRKEWCSGLISAALRSIRRRKGAVGPGFVFTYRS